MSRGSRGRWLVLVGAFFGLFVWMYDFDFFVNAGGPATPISKAILRALQMQNAEYPFPVVVPMFLLVASGAGAGAVIATILRHRGSQNNA